MTAPVSIVMLAAGIVLCLAGDRILLAGGRPRLGRRLLRGLVVGGAGVFLVATGVVSLLLDMAP